jgi:phenylalanyl-tRNA synthetase beta chain
MKASLNFLNTLVKVEDLDPSEIASKLTYAGVEVESVTKLASASNLVIGKILSCEKHPDSDHLHVLNVDEGTKYGVHQIVCGAPNARKGLTVIVAREGAKLPGGVIEKSTIRGVESDGMCCALYELGVDKKYLSEKQCAGIEELSEDTPIGEEDVLHHLGLDDTILDLDLLANRSDLNALENVAGEIGALYERPVKPYAYKKVATEKNDFAVGSLTPDCPLFGARVVKAIRVGPSPKWLRDVLTAEGVRSIDNVVDIGNFVMLLTGQPLNMYDLDKLPSKELVVRNDYEGGFVAMDEKTYKLVKGDLVVTSAGEPMCLAGIMTSKACAVTENTKNIVIEAAQFRGAAIRHTSSRLGLASESSARFVKGLNPNQTERVLEIASALLTSLCGAETVGATALYDTLPHSEKVITTSLSYINGRLGTAFDEETVLKTLARDRMEKLTKHSNDTFSLVVPSSRIDMVGEADVSEEVIRLLGYENVPSSLPKGGAVYQGLTESQKSKLAIRRYLREQGLDEALTYTLVNQALVSSFAYINSGAPYRLGNPMTEDHEYVRTNLLPSLLDAVSYNAAHQVADVAFFEVSDIDSQPEVKTSHLAIVLTGNEKLRNHLEKRPFDFYSVKGLFEGLADLLGLTPSRYRIERLISDKEEFHPGRSAGIYLGKTLIGVMGELHPKKLDQLGLKNAAALELDLGALLALKTSAPKAIVPPKFPSVSRDLAFVIDEKADFEEVRREILRLDKLITEVTIFDLYQGANIAVGKKSMALSLTLLNPEKTLTDGEVNAVIDKVVGLLKMRFLAEIRQ